MTRKQAAKCIDCGKPGTELTCNVCGHTVAVCPQHRSEYYPVDTPSDFVCVDCYYNPPQKKFDSKKINAPKFECAVWEEAEESEIEK